MPKFHSAKRASIRSRWMAMTMRLISLVLRHVEVVKGLALLSRFSSFRDRITNWLPSSDRMLSLHTMFTADISQSSTGYQKKPEQCDHDPAMIKGYGGSYGRVRLCQMCGARWRQDKETKKWEAMDPKEDPNKHTPLMNKEKKKEKEKEKEKEKADKATKGSGTTATGAAPAAAPQGYPQTTGTFPFPAPWSQSSPPPQAHPGFSPHGAPMFNPYLQQPEIFQQWNAFMQMQQQMPQHQQMPQQQQMQMPPQQVPTVPNVVHARPAPPPPAPPLAQNFNVSVGPSAAPEVYQMSEGGDAGMSTVESVILEGGTTSVSWPSQSAPAAGSATTPTSCRPPR